MNYNLFQRSSSNSFGDMAEKLFLTFFALVRGLPDGNFEKISKNSESTYVTEFCDLYNGIIGMDVQWIASELEWP